MSDFNSGSIESSLELDRDPFIEGLRLAREDAQRFEDDQITATINLDDEDAHARIDELEARADELSGKDIHINVDVDTGAAEAKLGALEAEVAGVDGSAGAGSLLGSFGMLGSLMGPGLAALAATGIGALPALAAAATGGIIGLAGAFGIAGAGLAAFGLIAKSDFTDMQNTVKDLQAQQLKLNAATTDAQRQAALKAIADDTAKLQGPAGAAALAYEKLQTALAKLKADTAPAVFPVITQALNIMNQLLPKLTPLINATGSALGGIFERVSAAVGSPGFTKFMAFLSSNIGPVLDKLATAFGNIASGIGGGLENSMPLINKVLGGLDSLTADFNKFANSDGYKKFVDFASKSMPEVATALTPLLSTVKDIIVGLGPAVGPALLVISNLGIALDDMAKGGSLDAIVSFFSSLAINFGPLLPLLADVLNGLLPILATLLDLATPSVAAVIKEILPPLADVLDHLSESVKRLTPFFNALFGPNSPFVKNLGPLFKDIGHDIDLILAGFDKLTTGKSGDALLVMFHVMGQVMGVLPKALDDLVKSLQPVMPYLGPLILAILAIPLGPMLAFALIIAGLAEALARVVPWFISANETMGRFVADMKSWFADLPGKIVGYFVDAATWLLNVGSDIISGLWTGLQNGYFAAENWFLGLWGRITTTLGDIKDVLYQIGIDIIHGLFDGLKAGWSNSVGWLEDRANQIAGIFSGVLQTHSPSRVFHELGLNVMQGLHNGLAQGFTDVDRLLSQQSRKVASPGFGYSGNISMAAHAQGQQLALAQAQTQAMGTLSGQLVELTNAVKQVPEATGDHVSAKLKPVFASQAMTDHQMALQRGRQGAMGH